LSGSQGRAPRTAIGWNKDSIYLVVVDGRQRSLSVGMSLPELADYMAHLGCEEAMNLDGGGSTTFWIYGSVQNSPSEGKERPAANALLLMRQDKKLD
jgi:exopolysaccharide biosynthesis protein